MKQIISICRSRKELTALSGLIFFKDLIEHLGLASTLGAILPKRERKRGFLSSQKFILGIYGFICGAECLDDLDELRYEPLFSKIAGSLSSTCLGKFLGKFRLKEIELLQNYLVVLTLKLRLLLPLNKKIILTIDATAHRQYGKKMEGVKYSEFKGMTCLDSQNVFDQYGFCYGWHLRSGATHSSVGSREMLEGVLSELKKRKTEVELNADSGYANVDFYNFLIGHKVNFAICLPETVWAPLLDRHEFKMGFKKTSLIFFDSNKCQIGSTLYTNKHLEGRAALRVVFIRAKKKKLKQEDKRYYDYYAIVTTFTEVEKSNEQVIEFYRQRSNSENFIKDLKYGLDFLHFPCKKINANRAWGLMGIIAYNLMKYASYLISPKTGCFMKKVRQKMVYLPAELVSHARSLKIRFHSFYLKEVMFYQQKLYIQLRKVFYPPDKRSLLSG